MGWSLSQIRRKNTRNKCRAILKLLFFTSQDDPTLNPVSLSLSLSFPSLSPRERPWLDLFTRPPKIWVVRKWDGREGRQSQETISATICLGGGGGKKGDLPKCAALAKWSNKSKSHRISCAPESVQKSLSTVVILLWQAPAGFVTLLSTKMLQQCIR